MTVLNCAHERFYGPLLNEAELKNFVIQPENRGTAPAILAALLRLLATGHTGPVAIFPSDHYVSDDFVLMRHVSTALHAVDLSPRMIVLLGITPDGPETEYGWIEPGAPVAASHPLLAQISQIRRFWEKPSSSIARDLYDRGYLWNSFILVAEALTLVSLIARALPELHSAFAGVRSLLDDATEHATEQEMLRTIYRDLPSIDFLRP